jgi:hypothetical protein
MARPLSGDIWHLSIDDLLAPLPEAPRLGGPGPFVINLSASTAPISQPIKSVVGCPDAHVYQIQRTEDRRLRYRLRLGPFATEDEADAVLEKVRDIYPGALTATADAEDLRALEGIQAKISGQAKVTAQPKVHEQPKIDAPTAIDITQPPPASIPVLSEEVSLARPKSVRPPLHGERRSRVAGTVIDRAPTPAAAPEVKPWVAEPPRAQSPQAAAPDAIPWVVEPPVAKPSAVKPSLVKPPITRPSLVRPLAVKPSPVPAAAKPVEQLETSLPSFESTQTIRPLTSLELKDEGASRWFVIQLSMAEQAFDPDSLPNLDIFSVYRLYSVAGLDQGRVMHALRLGFFSDEIAAGAVASYLTAFYQSSTVKRVSAAERERFAAQCFEARKDVGATGQHAAIEITSDRVVRESRIATVATPQKPVDPPSAPRMVAPKSRWF